MFRALCQQLWYYTQFVDVFGYDVKLLANGQSTYKTHIGALMSLLLFSLIFYSANSFIDEMNRGSNATLNEKEILLTENEVQLYQIQGFQFNSSEFVFAVGVVDTVGQVIPNQNNEIFSITFYFCSKYWNETNCTFIPSVPCGTLLREMTYDYEVTQEYENVTHCMNADYLRSIQNVSILGYQGMNTFTVIGAIVQSCQNSTESQNCAPQEDINKYLKNSNVFYTYTTFSFNKELSGNPYVKQQNTDVSVLFENTIKYIKVFQKYSLTNLEYNPFYFFPQKTYKEAIEYDKTIFDMALNIKSSNLIADLSIRLSAKKQLYYINYQTLMDVAAKIGGFYTILRLVMQILIFPIQLLIYKLYLINRLIQQQLSCSEEFQPENINKQINLFQFFKFKKARQIYWEESEHVDKLLDITEILFKPLRISKQVDNIHGSIKRLDKLKISDNNPQMDDLIFDVLESRVLSSRSINKEQPVNQILTSRISSKKN